MNRPPIDSTLMALATVWQDRSTCSRNQVGAVISMNGRAIGSGYNGAPAGMDHCDHGQPRLNRYVGEQIGWAAPPNVPLLPTTPYDRGCKEAIHAEANAIAYCARHGVSVEGATIHTTLSPCYPCSQLIISAGLVRVVYGRSYRDPAGIDLLKRAGLTVDRLGT